MSCPDPNLVAEFVEGVLDTDGHTAVAAHLETCADCRRVVSELSQPAETANPAPGSAIGRYVVLRRIGSGAMGAVYAAYDPELDRKVALKLLHHGDRQDRLVAEGRALARLAHPNVVPVLDLGTTDDGRVFAAMEFIDGVTLRGWLAAERRSWRHIVSVLVEAGRGLAAAHAVNLTHRDFKPENILIGRDERVRVVDFGLARLPSGSSPVAAHAPGASQSGDIAGTPAYMAPEQLRGGPATAASDQFAFSVVLWEALYGVRPFDDGEANVEELVAAVLRGRPRASGASSGVPPSLRRVLKIGLSSAPAERFASMAVLLTALSRSLQTRRLVGLAVAALAVVVFAAALIVNGLRRDDGAAHLCEQGAHELDTAWNPARRAVIASAYAQSEVPYAQAIWPHVDGALARWTADYAAMRHDACAATEVAKTQSREVLILRERCLDERRAEFEALVAVLEHPTPEIVERAPRAAAALGRVADCADVSRLVGPKPVSADAEAADTALRLRLATVRGRADAGMIEGARAALSEIAASARDLGDRSLEAWALVLRSNQEYQDGAIDEAVHSARDAVLAAEESRDDRTRVVAWIWLIVEHEELGAMPEALRAAESARAIMARMGGEDHVLAYLYEGALGVLEQNTGTPRAACDHFYRAVDHAERHDGAQSLTVATLSGQLARALMLVGDYRAADEQLRRAAAILRDVAGSEHPSSALHTCDEAALALVRGHADEALAFARDGLGRLERAYGPLHPKLHDALDVLNSTLCGVGALREASAVAERLLAVGEVLGSDTSEAQVGLIAVANTALGRHDVAAAERALSRLVASTAGEPLAYNHRKAMTLWSELHLAKDEVPEARAACVEAARELSPDDRAAWLESEHCFVHVEEAEASYDRARIRTEAVLAADEGGQVADTPLGRGPDLVTMGRLLVRLGEPEQAIAWFERAIAGEPEVDHGVVDSMVEARIQLARLLFGQDGARSEELARAAGALVARQEFPTPKLVAELRSLTAGPTGEPGAPAGLPH